MKEISVERKLAELREIAERLSSGEAELDESVKLFERGVKLAGEIETKLGKYEMKVTTLTGKAVEDDE